MFPDSNQADVYRNLVDTIMNNESYSCPTPMSVDEFEDFFSRYV